MQLTVKTLKGGKFTIEVEPSNTVAEAKAVIVSTNIIISSFIILSLFDLFLYSFSEGGTHYIYSTTTMMTLYK